MNDGLRNSLPTARYKIPYGTSEKPGLEGEVEDFEGHYSRNHALTLAQKLTRALQKESPSDDLRMACERFYRFCKTTLNYIRDLDAYEIRDGKISPANALRELREALDKALPIKSIQRGVSKSTIVADVIE